MKESEFQDGHMLARSTYQVVTTLNFDLSIDRQMMRVPAPDWSVVGFICRPNGENMGSIHEQVEKRKGCISIQVEALLQIRIWDTTRGRYRLRIQDRTHIVLAQVELRISKVKSYGEVSKVCSL